MSGWVPPDIEARRRILDDLRTNLLVEAGAGSGKTTSMVGRMVRLIRSGTAEVEEIAAVTFTRKAAAELRERFQEELEAAHRELGRAEGAGAPGAPGSAEERERLARALDGVNRGFVGTIHAFCARLLRERPLEAGVPPGFQEISGAEEKRLREESWNRFLERLTTSDRKSRLLGRLERVGLLPSQLKGLFRELSANPDVHFGGPPVERPGAAEVASVRSALERLLDASLELLPGDQPERGWDRLQRKINALRFSRSFPGWERDEDFLQALGTAFDSGAVTQNRWGSDKASKAAARALGERWEDFTREGTAFRLHRRWLAHRYPIALRFARTAARVYQAERRRAGYLDFQDLLMLTAQLLRRDADARREMGKRYRFLLVDEFQDTDPIQAELLFLLASDPGPHEDATDAAGWTRATPRPGALFLVGDPKQSIYRFRRADISLYSQVKRRLRELGDVLQLTANFRSTRPIGTFVDEVFEGPFPPEQDAHQAGFAPLNVSPKATRHEGVSWYAFEPDSGRGRFSGGRITEVEAPLLAAWIERRIRVDGRSPRDFMILTSRKKPLSAYAHALEAWGIPVELSGSGVGVQEELRELILLLRALGDPGNPVLTVAVLEGLFFGISHDELYAHAAAGGRFSFLREVPGDDPVGEALRRLHRFWMDGRRLPADLAVAGMVQKLGILPHAAAGELGSTRAAALLYALDALRVAGMDGKTSLSEAVEVLEIALEEEVDAPLTPGESDAVRIMNLHKAKGLQAPVVILAYPASKRSREITRHIARDTGGRAAGHVVVHDSSRRGSPVIARPLEWEAHEAAERPFVEAESARLLYVAATRAEEELVVARCTRTEDTSTWALFHPALDDPAVAARIAIGRAEPPPPEALRETGATIMGRIEAVDAARRRLAHSSYHAAPVSSRVKGPPDGRRRPSTTVGGGRSPAAAGGRGPDWGSAVHRALEVAAKGTAGAALRHACRGFLVEGGRPVDARGEPVELEELFTTVVRVTTSAVWARAQRAERLLVEAPFAARFTAAEYAALGVHADGPESPGHAGPAGPADAAHQIVEGVIDLAFRERARDGWVVVDYKSDTALPEALSDHPYRRQVELYAAGLEKVSGEPVRERILYFTAHDREVRW